ncbi:MAG: sulfurtransferase [Thermoplasmatota archaeon]
MPFGPLVSCEEAASHVGDPSWLFFDVRYSVADRAKGMREYAKGHIPGAYFADVDRDLSAPVGDGHRGRHPLPFPGSFQRFMGQHGVTPTTKIVAYDDEVGQYASRLWWLARHYRHLEVAVLDGGLTRWKALKLPLRSAHEAPRRAVPFAGAPGAMPTVETPTASVLLDARVPERFRGEMEPVDPKAGHIPGAQNLPCATAVGPDMRLLPPARLRERFLEVGATGDVACYCGSGVTATHLVLEAEVAGLPLPALYPGSWSEWCFPAAGRPIETGPARLPFAGTDGVSPPQP